MTLMRDKNATKGAPISGVCVDVQRVLLKTKPGVERYQLDMCTIVSKSDSPEAMALEAAHSQHEGQKEEAKQGAKTRQEFGGSFNTVTVTFDASVQHMGQETGGIKFCLFGMSQTPPVTGRCERGTDKGVVLGEGTVYKPTEQEGGWGALGEGLVLCPLFIARQGNVGSVSFKLQKTEVGELGSLTGTISNASVDRSRQGAAVPPAPGGSRPKEAKRAGEGASSSSSATAGMEEKEKEVGWGEGEREREGGFIGGTGSSAGLSLLKHGSEDGGQPSSVPAPALEAVIDRAQPKVTGAALQSGLKDQLSPSRRPREPSSLSPLPGSSTPSKKKKTAGLAAGSPKLGDEAASSSSVTATTVLATTESQVKTGSKDEIHVYFVHINLEAAETGDLGQREKTRYLESAKVLREAFRKKKDEGTEKQTEGPMWESVTASTLIAGVRKESQPEEVLCAGLIGTDSESSDLYVEFQGTNIDYQQRGLSKKLMAEVDSFAKTAGCCAVYFTHDPNERHLWHVYPKMEYARVENGSEAFKALAARPNLLYPADAPWYYKLTGVDFPQTQKEAQKTMKNHEATFLEECQKRHAVKLVPGGGKRLGGVWACKG
uniref:N-acetyltransferase domain-containing protein n=1 Tax=Chromera velia CCMP2878 TaxID=1169474 RepID=A0A0G4I3B6_9ALVE|eukprot:Cvel_10631.t1-p1 / transcript=Cvel_10631.t1 / gene=Cvel_10631 / organism=Chromera_velia_CCMP2878 / gene_product=hypothetical protein / transcript_product=hypothetical protein / location=Cvel_scaffold645:56187-63463(-) / protein_length=601 / sequence_SO=supercontig / SO=protein_coding / is_pseudo=false